MHRLAIALALLSFAVRAGAACPTPEAVAKLAADWQAKVPAPPLDPAMSMADAQCGQKLLLAELAKTQGKVVG